MRYEYTDNDKAIFRLSANETHLQREFFKERQEPLLAIVWNRGEDQMVTIDEVPINFPSNYCITLMVNQSFRFQRPKDVVLWQYNY